MATSRVHTRRMGLKKLFIAPITTNDGTTYLAGTPVQLGRAISMKLTDKINTAEEYSEDALEFSIDQYANTEVEIEVNALSPEDKADIFGNLYANGFLSKGNEDTAKEIALLYCAKKTDGKYEFGALYCGKFNEGITENYETASDKIKTSTATLKGKFYGRNKDGKYQLVVDASSVLDTNTDAKTAIESWFTAVQEAK